MVYRYDDKGKIFTDVVSTETIWVIVQTQHNRIEGEYHVRPGKRLKDQINQNEDFAALTNAVIYDLAGVELYRSTFLVLNKSHIIWLLPTEEILDGDQEAAGGDE
jgi:hypothetical protein